MKESFGIGMDYGTQEYMLICSNGDQYEHLKIGWEDLNERNIEQLYEKYYKKVINDILNKKPQWITIESLYTYKKKSKSIRKSMKECKFYIFYKLLKKKCKKKKVELRIASPKFASSKICYNCKHVKNKKEFKLVDRTYICNECGYVADRDYNASLNLRDCNRYRKG